jgi:SpoVK/Ycf46/Vps4 family AAA+-type ATPase
MSDTKIFDVELPLPDATLSAREKTLLGFEQRYERVRSQLRLLLEQSELGDWNRKFHGGKLAICSLVAEQYPLVIFHGDVGTGKTATAECIANRLVREAKKDDSVLLKLSNRVRGSGKVGEMGTLLVEAFQKVVAAAGKSRRAILLIDEGDSLAAARSQEHSHHEDKVAVNTLIQGIDDIRRFGGRVVVFLCTNRSGVLDPALQRRAAIVEQFLRPTKKELKELFEMDLGALGLTATQVNHLVALTDARDGRPAWTYSDIRTRLYPAALAQAYPSSGLSLDHLLTAAESMQPSPVVENA